MAPRVRLPAGGGAAIGLALSAAVTVLPAVSVLPAATRPAAPAAARSPRDPALQALRARFVERAQRGAWPSLALAVVRDGRVEWLEAFGWADRSRGAAATPSTLYALGSLSKSITATAVLQLVERGRVRLEDPIVRYGVRLPDPLGVASGATVDRLLRMTAGVPHGKWQAPAASRAPLPTTADLLSRFGGPVAAPGERYLYSNLSYGALELVVAHGAARSFDAFLREELFAPLGMSRSGTGPGPAADSDLARKHGADGLPFASDYRFLPPGGGGLYSCAADLARFALLHLGALDGAGLPTRAGLRRWHDATAPGEPSHQRYFAGWGVIDDGATRSLLSDGQVAGSNTALLLLPQARLGVVCLVNRTGSDALELAVEIVDALRPGYRAAFFRYVEEFERAESGFSSVGVQALAGRWRGTAWTGATPRALEVETTADGSTRWRFAGLAPVALDGAAFSSGPETHLHGIRFAPPGLVGTLPGVDLIRGELRDGARLEIQLSPRGPELVGGATNYLGDDMVPVVIRLEREARDPGAPGP